MPEVNVADADDWVTPAGARLARGGPDLLVLLDTDFGPDVDDAAAVCQLQGLANSGETSIVGCTTSSSCDYGPGALDAFNIWHGRGNLTIGAIQTDGLPDTSNPCSTNQGNFAQPTYENFPRNLGLRGTVTDSTTRYREMLSGSADGSVSIVTIGFCTGLELLLKSAGDGIDARNGLDLVKDKVKEWVCMGGGHPGSTYRPWNFHGSNTTKVIDASRYVIANWPDEVPTHFCPSIMSTHDWGYGQWNTGEDPIAVGTTSDQYPGHILAEAFKEFGGDRGTHLADPATVLYTVRRDRFSVKQGRFIWDTTADDGSGTWDDDPNGPHTCITGYVGTDQELMDEIEALLWTQEVAA